MLDERNKIVRFVYIANGIKNNYLTFEMYCKDYNIKEYNIADLTQCVVIMLIKTKFELTYSLPTKTIKKVNTIKSKKQYVIIDDIRVL